MHVLDVGCGAGDVSFLCARLVGTEGRVVGIDRSPESIALATQRAQAAGLENVTFVAGDVAPVTIDWRFDAIVGRLVLMYFADPAALLRSLLPRSSRAAS